MEILSAWLGKGFKSLSFLCLSALILSCGDTQTLNLLFDTGGQSANQPEIILVVSMSSDGTKFRINSRFCAEQDATGRCTRYVDFIEDNVATQTAVKGCAAFLGYVSAEDLQSEAFSGISNSRVSCATNLASALNEVFTGQVPQLPEDNLSQNGFNLVSNKEGYVFVISLYNLTTTNLTDDCFQLAAVKVQNAAFTSPLTGSATASTFVFGVRNSLATADDDTGAEARQKCFQVRSN